MITIERMIADIFKRLVPKKLKDKIKQRAGAPSLQASLSLIKGLGFNPKFAIDIGAYHGEWSQNFTKIFPSAKVLMIEGQGKKREVLEKVCRSNPNLSFNIALLSATDKLPVFFNESETASYVSKSQLNHSLQIISESLDQIVKREGLPLPDFLKLDVQGFELEVLKGGTDCLSHAEFCLLEVTLIDIDKTPLAAEVMSFMNEFNFQLYDITQLMRRPYDMALFQCDFLFIKKTSSLLSAKRWN